MKQSFTFLLALIISISTVAMIATIHNGKKNTEKEKINSEGEDDAIGRNEWERKRLADPSGSIPENIRMKELAFAATLPSDANMERTTNFINRGPWNVGGRTRAFGVDISNENRLLAGSCSGGMWISNDGGATWSMSNVASQLKNATCLVQDKRPTHTNVWYYGSGEAYGASASVGTNGYFLGDGLFKSVDSGATWTPVASTSGGNPYTFTTGWQLMWNIVSDVSAPDTTDELYAAIYGGIYRTVNGGTTWAGVKTGGSYYTDVAATTTGIVYATLSDDGSSKGIWRSPDGITYTKITPPGFSPAYNRIVIGINPNNENEVYFLANTPGYGKGTTNYKGDLEWNSLWKYTYLSGTGDSTGGSWQDLSINLPNTGGILAKYQAQGSYDMLVKVKPGSPNTVFIGGTNIYRSTTGFQDSTNTTFYGGYDQFATTLHVVLTPTYLNHHSDQHCLEFLPSNPDVMFSGNDGGVFKMMDNTAATAVWTPLNNGYETSMFYTVSINHAISGSNIITGGAQDNGSWFVNSASPTASWTHSFGGDGEFTAIADNGIDYYFSIQNLDKLGKATIDASGNVTSFARIDPIGGKGYQWMNPFVLDPNNNNKMYLAGGKYLWRNDDLASIPMIGNWDSISTNWVQFVDSVPAVNSKITTLTVCKTPANRVYYGTDKQKLYRVDNANVGTPTPIALTSTGLPTGGYTSCIAVDPSDGNKIIVSYSNYGVYSIWNSDDAGVTWSKCAGNLEATSSGSGNGPSVRWISILPVADGTVYLAGTSTGLYATDSLAGTSTVWVQQGANTIGNSVCDMMDVRLSDGLVVVATHANGMYSANITSVNDITSINDIVAAKEELDLKNYPNPVSSSTTIEFTTNKKGRVDLQLWDECGRMIKTIVNETMSSGKHIIEFSPENLRSGIYYYSLIADNKRKTNKMIVVK